MHHQVRPKSTDESLNLDECDWLGVRTKERMESGFRRCDRHGPYGRWDCEGY